MSTINLNMPAFFLGISEELEKNAKKRCWKGYEPVPGKKPYSEDSCRPIDSSKKAEAAMPPSYMGVRANFEDLASFPIDPDDFLRGGGILSFGEAPRAGGARPNLIPKQPISLPKSRPVPKPAVLRKKSVDLSSMPLNESIFPTSSSQLKWKYSRTPNALRLSDGNLVYSFSLPSDFPEEDTPVERLGDEPLTDFEKDVVSKGTAQIHRSSPDNIYLTLNDGRQNPTFMLQHEKDKQWRYSPSKKFVEKLKKIKEDLPADHPEEVEVDPEMLMAATTNEGNEKVALMGALLYNARQLRPGQNAQEIADDISGAVRGGISYGNKALDFMSNHPLESAFGGFLAAKGLKKLYDLWSGDPMPSKMPVATAAALGLAPVVAAKYIRGKY